jgi:hypothetical protein
MACLRDIRTGLRVSPDSAWYLGSAVRLVDSGQLGISSVDPETGKRYTLPLVKFPPLYSLFLAGPVAIGVDPMRAGLPLVLLAFGAFLLAVYRLTRRLGGGPKEAVGAVCVCGSAVSIMTVYGTIWSETLYLPLALGALAQVEGVMGPTRLQPLLLSVLLASSMLVRYEGILLWAAVLLWAVLSRLERRTVIAIAAAVAPLILWCFRNYEYCGRLFGGQETRSGFALSGSLYQAAVTLGGFLVPFTTPWQAVAVLGVASYAAYGAAACVVLGLVRHRISLRRCVHSPTLVYGFMFLVVHLAGPVIIAVWPMDLRFGSVFLSCAVPFVAAAGSRAAEPIRRASLVYVMACLVGALLTWLPALAIDPRIGGAGRTAAWARGVSTAALPPPPFITDAHDLLHDGLLGIRSIPSRGLNVITNDPAPWLALRGVAVADTSSFLERGVCTSDAPTLLVVRERSEVGRTAESVRDVARRISGKCPRLEGEWREEVVAFRLDQATQGVQESRLRLVSHRLKDVDALHRRCMCGSS